MENEVLNDSLYDAWNGYSGALFSVGNDEDDKEADKIYKSIDERMD